MKTRKWLKRSRTAFVIFLVCGMLSTLALFLHSRTFSGLFLGVGIVSWVGWMVNPLPVIFPLIGLWQYLRERKDDGVREKLGRAWIGLLGLLLGAAAAWLLFIVAAVVLTGGV